jgi:hypothetical protein
MAVMLKETFRVAWQPQATPSRPLAAVTASIASSA